MTTIEIIANFMKGNSKAVITEKQRAWLLGQAKRDGIPVSYDGSSDDIYLDNCFYAIRQCRVRTGGGSYVGSKAVQGKFSIEKMYTVRFTETGNTFVYKEFDVERVTREGYQFKIIPPHINTATRK